MSNEKLSQERINELLAKEEKLNRNREVSLRATRRRNARLYLLSQKAVKAGLSVSDAEIEAYLAKK